MQPENFDKIRVIAAINKRSAAMQIEHLIEQCILEYKLQCGQRPLAGEIHPSRLEKIIFWLSATAISS